MNLIEKKYHVFFFFFFFFFFFVLFFKRRKISSWIVWYHCSIIWTATRENAPSDMCAQLRLRSAWPSTQSNLYSLFIRRIFSSLVVRSVPSEDSNQAPVIRHLESTCSSPVRKVQLERITKTPLFKYIENFTSKNWALSDKKKQTPISFFFISAQNKACWYWLEPPRRGGSNEYHKLCFWAEIRKIIYTPVNPSFTI